MKEGLVFQVTSAEIADHLTKRITHHKTRAEFWKKQQELLGETVGDPQFSNKASSEAAQSKMFGHLKSASTMQLWKDHLFPDEIYELSPHDLTILEFTDERW